ncbi:hypothetical protein ACH4PU_24700 [Streptomyces sp. NPDC021100]|uniref:hypothetical protein n=1 Tax=Streptomyces sp. NPDC021100 TaxID=3365114 RepID=UPI0037B465A0
MGWTVLYIAFGVVGLWLLGEVLFQYKARLRWRLLAFTGFLGVVAGVAIPSVAVIAVGAVAFAIGQVYVTLSFRRGFSAGWALRRKGRDEAGPAASGSRSASRSGSRGGRRRGRPERGAAAAPAASDAPPAPGTPGAGRKRLTAAEAGAATTMMPTVPQQPTDEHAVPGPAGPGPLAAGPGDTAAFPAVGDAASVFGGGGYDYGQGQEQYPAYSDPYIGAGAGVQPTPGYEQPYDAYGQHGAYPQQYGQQQGQQYGQYGQYDMDTPPGGVWVPQQRQGDGDGQAPPPPTPPQGYGY